MRPDPKVPIEFSSSDRPEYLEEGLYRNTTSNHFFFLFRRDGKWKMQYSWQKVPFVVNSIDAITYAEKVNPREVIAELHKEKRFIESKLKRLTHSD